MNLVVHLNIIIFFLFAAIVVSLERCDAKKSPVIEKNE
jgi:hypothetical protein